MNDKIDEKAQSPFDSSSEDEAIALSKDELNDILSEAEIVKEVEENHDNTGKSPEDKELNIENLNNENIDLKNLALEDDDVNKGKTKPQQEDDFDISEGIDQLTPEDLENIEIGDEEEEAYTQDLEKEIGNEIDISELPNTSGDLIEEEISDEELEKELEQFDTEGMQLEVNLEEEDMDLDSYIKSVEDKVGEEVNEGESPVEEANKKSEKEELDEDIMESPILGEVEDINLDAGDISKETEPEDIGTIDDIELPTEGEEQTAESAVEELSSEELPDLSEIGIEEKDTLPESETEKESLNVLESELEGEELATTSQAEEISTPDGEEMLEGGVELTEEEERILKEDIDLTSEEEEEEEVVSLSGDELDKIVEEGEIIEEEPETAVVDKTLLNDITVILKYLDDLLGNLPDKNIKEFAGSKYFSLYKKVFDKLSIS